MRKCRLCGEARHFSELLDLGPQPVCHRFLREAGEEEKYPLALGQCGACGLVQLMEPFPVEQLTPKYDWVKYREPEAHLDDLADKISSLPGINTESRILGLIAHDEVLLKILAANGFHNVEMIDPIEDLGHNAATAGAEIVQNRLRRSVAGDIAQRRGTFDIIVARRIVEHAYNLSELMQAFRSLMRPNGHLIIEVPDSEHAFEFADAGVIWEEHVLYFTPETFRHSFPFNGFRVLHFESYPYLQENCLVAIVQPDIISPAFPESSVLRAERRRAVTFADQLERQRDGIHRFLSCSIKENQKVAILGAGHRSAVYINSMQIGSYLECVIDDDPNKQNLEMPGSCLPIRGSSALIDNEIKLCLLAINPESEEKVIQKNRKFLENGGAFFSVSPDSKYALRF